MVVFRRFFNKLPAREARRLAWIEMGAGALLPGGGVGSLAVSPHWRLLGAIGYLGFDIAVLGLTCAGVGHSIGAPALVLAYIIGYGANALPVPGGIGVLEGGLVGALVLYGTPVMPANAAVLVYHTIAFWIPSLGGAVAYTLTLTRQSAPPAPQSVHVLERSFRDRRR